MPPGGCLGRPEVAEQADLTYSLLLLSVTILANLTFPLALVYSQCEDPS
jgi:hypothetical protein